MQKRGPLGKDVSPSALLTTHLLLAHILGCIFFQALRTLCHIPALVTGQCLLPQVKLHGPTIWSRVVSVPVFYPCLNHRIALTEAMVSHICLFSSLMFSIFCMQTHVIFSLSLNTLEEFP